MNRRETRRAVSVCGALMLAAGATGMALNCRNAHGAAHGADHSRANAPVVVALTAEFGLVNSTSAQAIEQGLRLAIAEINAAGGVLGNRPLRLVARDDRSMPARAIRNFNEFLQVPDLVAVFGGKFSPVLIELAPLARQANMPLLAPWSSADEVTGGDASPDVVFRLSLKDSWAIEAMVRHLVQRRAVRRIGLLVPNTAWGRSSLDALRRAAARTPFQFHVQWYSWGETSLMPQYHALRGAGADGLILVANESEAALLLREIAALAPRQRLPVAAHAGVMGGDLFTMAGPALAEVDFSVVQTFTFAGSQTPVQKRVLRSLSLQNGGVPVQRVSSAGFAHAYDLMHLLAKAVDAAGTTDRTAVRRALEQLGTHAGLVRTYVRPFAPGRHDALSPSDVFMARFGSDGHLIRSADK